MINVADPVWTAVVSVLLMLTGGLALLALPWTDRDINRVHRAAVSVWGRRPARAMARQLAPAHRR